MIGIAQEANELLATEAGIWFTRIDASYGAQHERFVETRVEWITGAGAKTNREVFSAIPDQAVASILRNYRDDWSHRASYLYALNVDELDVLSAEQLDRRACAVHELLGRHGLQEAGWIGQRR